MKASILEERVDDTSPDFLPDVSEILNDLTQQEIESGLAALHCALNRKRLPFVVLIEDNDAEAEFFRFALQTVGVAVEFMHFHDGQQAIDFFNGEGCYSDRDKYPLPQLTVLDFKLTRLSGLQILHEIRMKHQLERLVVVALTGSKDAREIDQAHSLAINGWINKPQSIIDLVEIVRRLLRTWLPSLL